MARVGLVLGAGGTVGQAYHAGVLAALEHDLGWDPRSADVIVGTSAGSVTGTLLRLGVPAHDLAAWAVRAPLSVESTAYHEWLGGERPQFPPLTLDHWIRRWRLPPRRMLQSLAKRPWSIRPTVIATTMMPAGRIDLLERASALREIAPREWPENLWLCATRRDDGERVVFGRRGSPPAGVDEAVAASCAIPGYFVPREIGGREYFDGGVYSPSNADVLRDEGCDVVVVVSPMSAAGGWSRTADAAIRYAIHRRLERELQCLARQGVEVVRIEPGRATLSVMGVNMMANDRSQAVVQESFIEAGRYAASERVARRLSALATRPSRERLYA